MEGEDRAILLMSAIFCIGSITTGADSSRFLGNLGLDPVIASGEKNASADPAGISWTDHPDEFHESHLRLRGINRPEDIQRGKEVLIEDENEIEFFPGVRDTLIELKEKGFLMGIITDAFQPVSKS